MNKKNITISEKHIELNNIRAFVGYYLGKNFHQTKDLPECVVINERDFSGRLRQIFPYPCPQESIEEFELQFTRDMQCKKTVVIFKNDPLFSEVKKQALDQIERWENATFVNYTKF
jgi:hypothetical protein